MLVNFERRVCFLLHPKTASRTTAKALQERSGFVSVSDHHACWRPELYPEKKLVQRGLDPENVRKWDWSDPPAFVYVYVIRNPFDTLASWYEDMAHVRGQELGPKWYRKFIRHHPKLFPKKGLWPYVQDTPPGPSVVLKYESLAIDLVTLSRFLRFPDPTPLEVIGQTLTRAPNYQDYFTPESRAWVEETFPDAIQAGGYVF
jgi:hypothetical protein